LFQPLAMAVREFCFEQDYEAAVHLWQTAGPGVHLSRSDAPAELRKKLTRDPDLFLVAEAGGRLVGTVLGGFDGRRGMVYHLAVDPAHRGQGLGRALMAELEARLRARGCVKCYLMVDPDNAAVVDFYRQLGWDVLPVHILGKDLDRS
jgi:ribosomal protein S18 acetylase RimI-like enzyme